MIFTATETSTRFYITKGWSANSETPLQEITLDYLTIVEIPNQINYISCTSLNNNLTMLSNSGVNINDSLSVKGYLNAYYNAQFSYLAYQQVISNCATYAGSYVLPRKGTQADFVESGYRFGFNGMERDDEIKGSGNSYDFGARIYDSRLGRWLAADPAFMLYPSVGPYISVGNNPIYFIDPNGKWINKAESEGWRDYRKELRKTKAGRITWKDLKSSQGEVVIKLVDAVLINSQQQIVEGITLHPGDGIVMPPSNGKPQAVSSSTIYISLGTFNLKTRISQNAKKSWNDLSVEEKKTGIQGELATGHYKVNNAEDLYMGINEAIDPTTFINVGINTESPNIGIEPIANETKGEFIGRVGAHEGTHPFATATLLYQLNGRTQPVSNLKSIPESKKEEKANKVERDVINGQKENRRNNKKK